MVVQAWDLKIDRRLGDLNAEVDIGFLEVERVHTVKPADSTSRDQIRDGAAPAVVDGLEGTINMGSFYSLEVCHEHHLRLSPPPEVLNRSTGENI